MKYWIVLSAFTLLLTDKLFAQHEDPFLQMEREMQKLMDQMQPGSAFSFPPGSIDTSFEFKLDTMFQGDGNGGGSFFFRFDPFSQGNDSTGFEDMMKRFREFSQQLDPNFFDQRDNGNPADDGALRNGNQDELLPEERLRQQESPSPAPKTGDKSVTEKPEQKKPKIKTSKI